MVHWLVGPPNKLATDGGALPPGDEGRDSGESRNHRAWSSVITGDNGPHRNDASLVNRKGTAIEIDNGDRGPTPLL